VNIADNINLRDAVGVGVRPVSLDQIRRAAPQEHLWTFTGTANASQTDQAPYYNLLADVAESNSHILGTPTPPTGWSTATMARYIADNPAGLRMIHLTNASVDRLFDDATLRFVRSTPDASAQTETVRCSTFVDNRRFDQRILSIPINGEVFDGYTYVRILTRGAASPNSYTATFVWGASNDKRADAPPTRAAVVAGPG
jgi:hypothetical protein